MKRTIAITGATGFVGRAVVQRLLKEDDITLRCLVRPSSDTGFLDDAGDRVTLVEGDVTDRDSLPELLDGAWGVINLAGHRDFWSASRGDYYQLNERGAENVFLAALAEACQKVVQVSTPLAFGMPERRPFDEECEAGPHPSDYARSKFRGDRAGWRLHEQRKLPLTVVHLAAVIGAGDPRPTMEVRRAAKGQLPVLVGADKTFTYVYIHDAAEAIVRALLREDTVGRRYLIGDQRASTREYFDMIADLAGVEGPTRNIPEAFVLPLAQALERVSHWTGLRNPIPADIIATTAAGSLLFDATRSKEELEMSYTPLRTALGEAVDEILHD